jgi:GT2 family glycosyltransferase|tara:strand:- start:3588 stop:4403 length:816 start_codon:yes stop_codon:yes gene_type:complete
MKSDITVILLLYKTPIELLNNLKSYKKFNVIVLDQSNDKIFKKRLLKIIPNIKNYQLSKKNHGFAKGINKLVKKVKTKYFFCTQPDVSISERSIIELKKTMQKRKSDAAIVVPSINIKRKYFKNQSYNEVITKSMIGATFLSDKRKFENLGMFDEDFFFYWEDIEFSNRIQNSNFKIFKNKKSIAIHQNSKSSGDSLKIDYIRSKNFIYGELLYDFKVKKIRILKIIRKLIQNLVFFFFNILLFQLKATTISFAKIIGILKFLKFYIKKNY